jgi:hypothetical protein
MANELKPCPFCGGLPYLWFDEEHARIYCQDCHCEQDQFETDYIGTAIDKAVETWNSRTKEDT